MKFCFKYIIIIFFYTLPYIHVFTLNFSLRFSPQKCSDRMVLTCLIPSYLILIPRYKNLYQLVRAGVLREILPTNDIIEPLSIYALSLCVSQFLKGHSSC